MFTKIEALCKEKDWSIYRLAQEAGISEQVLAQCKKRNSNLSVDSLSKVAKALGKPMEYFVTED